MTNILFLVSIFVIPAFISMLKLTSRFRWLLVSLSFALISSLRPNVGMDFEAYESAANNDNTFLELVLYYKEPFSALLVLIGQIFSLQIMLFLFSFCYALGVFFPLMALTKKSFLLYFFALYLLPMGFMFSFDGIRQAAGIGLLMLALALGSKRLGALAIFTHASTVFILGIFYFSKFKSKILVGVTIGILLAIAALYLKLFFGLIWKYEASNANQFGGTSILFVGFIGSVMILLPKIIRIKTNASTTSNLFGYAMYSGAILSGASLAFLFPNMLVLRLLYFFVPLGLFGICMAIENSRIRGPLRVCFFSVICASASLYWATATPRVIVSVFG